MIVYCVNYLSGVPIGFDDQVKSVWFNYVNHTLSALKDAVINENQTQNHNIMETIGESQKGKLWANQKCLPKKWVTRSSREEFLYYSTHTSAAKRDGLLIWRSSSKRSEDNRNRIVFISMTGSVLYLTSASPVHRLCFLVVEVWLKDSMGRPNSGVLKMSLSFLGFYSECIDTKAPNFETKYCLATIHLPKTNSDFFHKLTNLTSNILSKVPVRVGTCVPASCSPQFVAKLFSRISSSLISESSVSVNKCYKRSDDNIETDISSIIVISVFGLILAMVIVGTLCDHWALESHSQLELLFHPNNTDSQKITKSFESYEKSSKSLLYEILICFSVKINARKIFDTKGTDTTIQVFHGIRVLSMLWILIGHSFAFAVQWMTFRNPLVIREVPQNIMSQLLANGTFSVDCFFFISGFLVSYIAMTKMKRSEKSLNNSRPNILLFYFHRYLRMTPSMMAVIAFSATLLRYLGSGPQWTQSITMFNGWCQKNWWINSLYLHNFVNTQNMCLSHSWYSAVDMQFYFLSPLILIPLYMKPMLGICLAIVALFASMGFTGYLTLINGFPAVPYINDVIEQAVVDKYYALLYIKPYCRVGPYLVGILLAYAIYTSKGDIKMKKFYSITGWFISFVVSFGVLFAMLPANNGNVPEVHIAALYSSTSRTIWALSLAWVTFACITGNGGFVNAFLSARVWMPLSRLTHCSYLVHPIVMSVLYGSREHPFDFSSYLFTYFTISHIFITYIVSFVLSLLIESPFIAISRLFITRRT
ncbi:unnamed protein product [Medioppia subpectinata]|uniref:Nose resistant-to-fluoxetine protein N-terminal domain-containing protein n=1 Tax=Medioppia subpectinata TaxID=1979941 RepID=A0A7R9KMH3_9ACAR|nr:unnamed protein product [Medioppia subpectinata]CAG2106234.1 unnamed protein product [Medioppia subpectinata]